MGPVSGLVLFLIIWFMTFLVVLPIKIQTQGDLGEIVPGTHAGSPTNPQLKKRFLITSGIAFVLWAIIAGVIISGLLTVRDIDWFNRMATPDL